MVLNLLLVLILFPSRIFLVPFAN